MAKNFNHLTSADIRRSIENNFSDYVNVYVPGGSATSITVPAGYTNVSFASTGDFAVNFNGGTASYSGATDGTGSEINPTTRYIAGKSTLSIFAAAGITISAAFYS
jgi:hypothetical protein